MMSGNPHTASSPSFKPLEHYKVPNVPDSLYYIPNYITADEEALLLNKIQSAPLSRWTNLSRRRLQSYPSKLTSSNTLLAAPLPVWLTHPVVSRLSEITSSLPPLPESSSGEEAAGNTPRTEGYHVFAGAPHGLPNHVLVNEYEPGQGIMPHEDGAAYWPVVATVSLGGSIVLDIHEKGGEEDGEEGNRKAVRYRILQESRSLLVTTDGMYTDYLHGIAETEFDEDLGPESIANWDLLGSPDEFSSGECKRKTRISLTCRDVLKVSNIGNKIKLFRGT